MATKTTIAELLVEIGVDAKDAEKAANRIKKSLKDVGTAGKKADKGVSDANKALAKFSKVGGIASKVANTVAVAMVGAVTATVGLAKSVLTVGARFESLRKQLKTTTGSTREASKAFQFIKDFASKTPFQVDQITEAFVKLNNFGIDPTKRTLTAFGDFASAFGKSFNDVVEAVTDATTGEFERLKEFGIKTSSEGDRVKLTFRGVTTEIGKNSEEIEEFLTNLAETNFGGAMAEQATTAMGLISNLQDTWAEFMETVANLGPLDEFKLLINDLSEAAGGRTGLAKQLASFLTKAIRGVRRLLKGNLIPTLERLLSILEFVINNLGKLAAVFAAGKLISGVAGLASAFGGLGLSITALTGPVGIAIGALAALGFAAVAVSAQINSIPKIPKAPGPEVDAALRILAPENAPRLAAAQKEVQRLRKKIATNPALFGGAGGLETRNLESALRRADRLTTAVVEEEGALARTSEEKLLQESKRQFDEIERARSFILSTREDFDPRDPGTFTSTRELEGEVLFTGGFLTDEEQARLDASTRAITGGKSFEESLVSDPAPASKKKRGGRRQKKTPKKEKKAKRQIRPPTTVSEFFGAAARGDLGTIADRTPSTRDIEPTVAVDITNNNFNFRDTFNITGTTNPAETGKQVVKLIKVEFDRRLSNAGQALQPNMAR